MSAYADALAHCTDVYTCVYTFVYALYSVLVLKCACVNVCVCVFMQMNVCM